MLHFTGKAPLFSYNQICLIKIHEEYCAIFDAVFVAPSVCIMYLKSCCIFPESFICMQMKLESFTPEIVSALENAKSFSILSHFKVHRKSATNVQPDGRITTDGPLYTGHWQ